MADTRQVVFWCLDYACALRTGAGESEPGKALMQTERARSVSRDRSDKKKAAGIFSDVYVSDYIYWSGSPHRDVPYPSNGFVLSREFASIGGVEALRPLCAACPANTTPDYSAGCAGALVYHSNDTEVQLQRILSRCNLEQDYKAAFLPTTPLWYGLWAQSPLSPPALRVVRTLLSEWIQGQLDPSGQPANPGFAVHLRAFSEFIRATEIAEQSGLPLSVSLSPPGHTDFGFYTVFPHCPRCKAAAKVKRWQRHYPTDPYTCLVCNHVYSPAETASSTPMSDDDPELREILGQSEFEAFTKGYLMTLGANEEDALEIISSSEEEHRQREIKLAATRRGHELMRWYVLNELCRDLHARPPDDYHGDYPPWFQADDFLKLVERCVGVGADIAYMNHETESGDMDRTITRKRVPGGIDHPEEILRSWLEAGCNGWFCANIASIPDHLSVK